MSSGDDNKKEVLLDVFGGCFVPYWSKLCRRIVISISISYSKKDWTHICSISFTVQTDMSKGQRNERLMTTDRRVRSSVYSSLIKPVTMKHPDYSIRGFTVLILLKHIKNKGITSQEPR